MAVGTGDLLKNIRTEVFDLPYRKFSEILNMHHTTYLNYEKNKLGKNPVDLIVEISKGLANSIITDPKAKLKLKDTVVSYFLMNCHGLVDCNYLLSLDLNDLDNIREYLEYSLYLAFVEGHISNPIESELYFHSQWSYCVNKVLAFSSSKDILLLSHIEDYNIHLNIFKNNPSIKIDYCLEGLTPTLETLILDIANKKGIQNFKFIKENYRTYIKNNKLPSFVFVCFYFHHIDKIDEKLIFLEQIYKNLPKNGILCIFDPFFDDNDTNHEKFATRWSMLAEETAIKKFWTSLKSFEPYSIDYAKEFSIRARNAEVKMGEDYLQGIREYLVTLEWLENEAKKIGFKTVLKNNVNSFCDAIIIFQK